MTLDVHVVSHTHWDREWYFTREQFRLRLVDLIDRVLELLETEPRFRYFHLDGQTIVLEDYLEVRPERREDLRREIAAGRLLVGPWYVMPDMFLVSGEALVRNLTIGHRIATEFGRVMPVGYIPDPFGHVAQMPQILRGFGLDNTVLWRGFGGRRAEYWWEAPDGSRVLLLHLPNEGYCNATRVALVESEMLARTGAVIERERERTAFGQVLLMAGVDHLEPHPALPALIDRLAAQPGLRARHSTLPDYVDAVRKAVAAELPERRDSLPTRRGGSGGRDHSAPQLNDGKLETIRGELRAGEEYAHLLPGVLSARVYLKQANVRVQTELERWAEPFSTFAWLRGAPYPAGLISYAWKVLLQNHPHDSICGCSIDAVHEENETRFARAQQVAEGLTERALTHLARQVGPAGEGSLRVVVFNPSAASRAGVVEAVVDLPLENAEPWRKVDPEALDEPIVFLPRDTTIASVRPAGGGEPLPFQVLAEEDAVVQVMSRYETPWAVRMRRFRVCWSAEVPGCGYAAFDLGLSSSPAAPVAGGHEDIENEYLRLTVNDDGTIDVLDKRTGTSYRRCAELTDVGDVGDEYNYSPPRLDRPVSSDAVRGARMRRLSSGPLRTSLEIEHELILPAAATRDRSGRTSATVPVAVLVRVHLDAGSPRVLFEATVANLASDHRLRVLFPTASGPVSTVRADTAFDVVERPARRDVPAHINKEAPVSAGPLQSFVDAGDERHGVTVFSQGLMEYEVAPAAPPRIGLTLLRCVGDLSREDLSTRPGPAGPSLPAPGAQCLGTYTFRFAMEPRGAPPAAADLCARGAAFLAPCRAVTVAGGTAVLPPRLSFVSVGGPVALSALKKTDGRDSIVMRLFNPGVSGVQAKIATAAPLLEAHAVDLLERRQEPLPHREREVSLALGAHAIRSVELVGRSVRRGPAPADGGAGWKP
jgi:mannosylglycerate hydrolase